MTLLIIHFAVLHELEAPLGMSHVLRFELCFREALGGFRRCLSWVPRPLRLLTSLRSAIHLAYRFCSAHIRLSRVCFHFLAPDWHGDTLTL